ncbi:hypothetical protein PIB30_040549 [Stylosanthes scabra]|uniref:Uncharacterized protein n=1 Tax=Stylosanthes scabra TaxID=79078 RepID=A0ABU6UF54_9FABA|nr:hypothetical protein [Stylosanthes scabra]
MGHRKEVLFKGFKEDGLQRSELGNGGGGLLGHSDAQRELLRSKANEEDRGESDGGKDAKERVGRVAQTYSMETTEMKARLPGATKVF